MNHIMNEPYNDEDIEKVKEWLKNAPLDSNRRWVDGEGIVYERLIATVDYLKWTRKILSQAVTGRIVDIQRLQKENDRLKQELKTTKNNRL